MKKRLPFITLVMVMLALPGILFAAADKFTVAKAVTQGDNIVVVPLTITNQVELAALDIPLSFTEGVTLKEVDFEGTRVEYFDFKKALIDNEKGTVVIGLLPMFSTEVKPDLAVGDGVIANLVFEINDPSVSEISVEAFEMDSPRHTLTFVYHDENRVITSYQPEFATTTVALNNLVGEGMPNSFTLNQNYPNPFNPTTTIAFDLPNASVVSLDIYNVLGQKVDNLVDGNLEAGSHFIEYDASSLSSGIYFYRITAENFEATKKMVLMK